MSSGINNTASTKEGEGAAARCAGGANCSTSDEATVDRAVLLQAELQKTEAEIADTDAQYQYRLTRLTLAYTVGQRK